MPLVERIDETNKWEKDIDVISCKSKWTAAFTEYILLNFSMFMHIRNAEINPFVFLNNSPAWKVPSILKHNIRCIMFALLSISTAMIYAHGGYGYLPTQNI